MGTRLAALAVAGALALAGCGGDDEDGGEGAGEGAATTEQAAAPSGPALDEIKSCLEKAGAKTEDGVAVLVFGLDQAKGGGFQATFDDGEEVDVVVAQDDAEREKLLKGYEAAGGNRSSLAVEGNAIAEIGSAVPEQHQAIVEDCLRGE